MDYTVTISSGFTTIANIVDRQIISVTIGDTATINYNYMEYTTKRSSVDAGTIGDRAYDDDYLYTCTKTGTAGNAIWKKTPLLNT